MDGNIKFGMLTGVTKFGKVSVFSDLNNLDDISMREPYVDLCGISEQEIHDNLEEELHELAKEQKITYQEVCDKLKNTTTAITLSKTPSAYTTRSACSTRSNTTNSAAIGLRPEHHPIWSSC